MKKSRILVSVLLILSMVLSSMSFVFAAPVKGNVIVDSEFADPECLVGGWGTDVSTSDIAQLLFTPLVDNDDKGNMLPGVAESWSASKDGLSWTVKLRKGWKWQDGVELTADDVKFTFEMIMSSSANAKRRQDILDSYLKNVTVKDKYTAVFNLSKKNVWFEYMVLNTNYWLPKHILGNVAPADITKNDYFKHPIGNGAFKFVKYAPGERIEFEPFKGYSAFNYPNYPKILLPKKTSEKFIYQIVPTQATSILKVQTGEANYTYIPATDIAATKKISSLMIKDFPDATDMYLSLNMKRPFFADKNCRQAIAYAINKEALARGVYKGYYKPASAYYPDFLWYHNPNIKQYNYDVAKAKQLLDAAGWKVGKDGIREKNGVKFSFTLIALKGNANREKTCVFIQSSLKQIGIQVEVRSLEWVTMNTKYLDTKNYDACYIAMGLGTFPSPSSEFAKAGTFNHASYYNPEMEVLCQKINEVSNKEEAKKIMYRVQELVQDELPVIVLLYPNSTYAMAKNTKDIDMYAGTWWLPSAWHAEGANQ